MANIRNANTYYMDTTTASLTISNIKVLGVLVTATSANAILNLQDVTTSDNKMNLRVATSGDSKYFDFADSPVVFPTGIKPSVVTNCVATAVIRETRG